MVSKKLTALATFFVAINTFIFAQNKVIPFETVNYNGKSYYAYCVCRASINGIDTPLAIDTGTNFTLVPFPVEQTKYFQWWLSYGLYDSRYDFKAYQAQSFIINGEDFSNGAYIAEFPDDVKAKWTKFGILGFDLIAATGSVFRISPTNGNIEFSDAFDTTGYESCELWVNENKCYVKISVDGEQIWAILDTGYLDGTLALPVFESKKFKKLQMFALHDEEETLDTVYIVKNVKVFDIDEKEIRGYVETPFKNCEDAEFAFIGKKFLNNYELIFNLKESKLYYKRNSDFRFYEFPREDGTGIKEYYLTPDGHYLVTKVVKGSEADKKGIRVNQEIYSLNGILIKDVYEQFSKGNLELIKQLDNEIHSGKKLRITIRDGDNLKEVVLKKRKIF